jgi:hypothetical protein
MIEGQTQIKSGDTLHLYCKVSGYPIPVIEWYRDGDVIVKDDTRTNFLPYGVITKYSDYDVLYNNAVHPIICECWQLIHIWKTLA